MTSSKRHMENNMPGPSSPLERRPRGEAVIAIFDVGKTNKKLLLFNEQYKLVHEECVQLEETTDEDGFPCENVNALTQWIKDVFKAVTNDSRFDVKAVNFSAYGASFVHLDNDFNVFLPLYNYLKPFPSQLQQQFYDSYGGVSKFAKQTASPVLGNLNSGMQLYRLKYEKPEAFEQIKFSLHLPQYISHILTSKVYSDITSVGCHTNLWDFQHNEYHRWVKQEGVASKLPPVLSCEKIAGYIHETVPVGAGLHDSSAALIPYLTAFTEPFILLSTGTWCISLNPFNRSLLTDLELHQDCLCFLSYQGTSIKASRLFAGYEHEQQTKRLAAHFSKPQDYFSTVKCDINILARLQKPLKEKTAEDGTAMVQQSNFGQRDLHAFADYETAYHQLIADIIVQQVRSTKLVLKGSKVKQIFVDGGFSKNPVYMRLLAENFSDIEVYAAKVAQASSLGAALAMHQHWNKKSLPDNIIELKLYSLAQSEKS
ncbi:MAG: FGGY family carbohydrate kinase [Panacibacter sp.]